MTRPSQHAGQPPVETGGQSLILSQFAPNNVMKRTLELRISVEVQRGRKPNHARRTDLGRLCQLCDAHERHVLVLAENILGHTPLTRRDGPAPAIEQRRPLDPAPTCQATPPPADDPRDTLERHAAPVNPQRTLARTLTQIPFRICMVLCGTARSLSASQRVKAHAQVAL